MINLNLDANESIRLSYEQVEWMSDNHRKLDQLVLTDKALYCVYLIGRNMRGEQTGETYRFNLSDIIIQEGISQIEPVWIQNEECLQIQFRHGMEYFAISRQQEPDALRGMIRKINEILGAKEKAVAQRETVQCLNCGKILPANAKYCFFCRTRVTPVTQTQATQTQATPENVAVPQEKPVEIFSRSTPQESKSIWYVAIDGQPKGPFEEEVILQMAQARQIDRNTLVWKTGMQEWIAIEKIDDMKSIVECIPPALF